MTGTYLAKKQKTKNTPTEKYEKKISQLTGKKFTQMENQLTRLALPLNLIKYEDFPSIFYASIKHSFIFSGLQKKDLGIDTDGGEGKNSSLKHGHRKHESPQG